MIWALQKIFDRTGNTASAVNFGDKTHTYFYTILYIQGLLESAHSFLCGFPTDFPFVI